MKKIVLSSILFVTIILSPSIIAQDAYEPTWTSLRNHKVPKWLEDAKFGIYCHWGVWTIQYAEGYKEGGDELELDKAISKFTAKKFDAKNWAKLFKSAGAKFGGPVAWHGTKYLHWDSQYTNYNSVKMSPHRDIVGELEKAIRDQGLKFFVSYHYNTHTEDWIDYAKEGIDNYSPDIFWVDAGFGGTKAAHSKKIVDKSHYIGVGKEFPTSVTDKRQRNLIAHYFNHALQKDKEVQVVYKSYDIPPGVGMRDLENGLLDHIAYDTWMTDIDMNICPDWETHGWFYREGIPLRSANNLVDLLVDIVSKNGVFLLNVPPLADGSFSPEIQTTLLEVGNWLKKNGKAIYGASPWFIYGEGPTRVKESHNSYHHNDHFATNKFTHEDIRFTVNGAYLYVTCLGKPTDKLNIKALNSKWRIKYGQIDSVSFLGSDEPVQWNHTPEGLIITIPEKGLSEYANVFEIKLN